MSELVTKRDPLLLNQNLQQVKMERGEERKNENVEGAEWTVKEEVKRKEQRRGGEREESGREGEREGGKEGSGLR